MRSTVVLAACLAALSACSKPDPAAEETKTPTPSGTQPEPPESTAVDARTAAFIQAVKKDFATQFTATAADACGSVKGQEMPDLKSGSPMEYSAGGGISWGRGSLDYVKEAGAHLVLSNARAEKTFSFVVDIYDVDKGGRRYVAGLSQLKGASLSATVTDETKTTADGDSNLTSGNVCVGHQTPPLVSQGAWALAARHLQVAQTRMSCGVIGKLDTTPVSFSFDGKTLQAGKYSFTAADAAESETLIIDPNGNSPGVTYSVSRGGDSGAGIGLSRAGVLSYARLVLPGGVHMGCLPAQ